LLGYKPSESTIAIHLRFGSIDMPRRFSRLTLEVTEVRVQQVNDTSEADAIAEGLKWSEEGQAYNLDRNVDPHMAFNNVFARTTDFALVGRI
jgi:hypothetical protein